MGWFDFYLAVQTMHYRMKAYHLSVTITIILGLCNAQCLYDYRERCDDVM